MSKILLLSAVALLFSVSAYTQATMPFTTCTNEGIAIVRAGGNASVTNPFYLYSVSSATGGATQLPGGPYLDPMNPSQNLQINGIGINRMDGFIYGLGVEATVAMARLLRLDKAYGVTNLGFLTAPPAGAGQTGVISPAAGDMDDEGNYWFTAATLMTATGQPTGFFLGKVSNVAALPSSTGPVAVTYVPVIPTSSCTSFMTALASSFDNTIKDLSFNAATKTFFAYATYSASGAPPYAGQVIEVRPITGSSPMQLEVVCTPIINTHAAEVAGTYIDNAGNFLVLLTDGSVGRIGSPAPNVYNGLYIPLNNATGLPNPLRGDMAPCNGTTPPMMTWYRDFDSDGFGDPNKPLMAPTQPAGYVDNNLDCNDYKVLYQDNDGEGWGSSVKVPCDGVWRTGDCNDNDPKIHSLQTFHRDADGDSYGDVNNKIQLCTNTPPEGYVKNSIDCNDGDPKVYWPKSYYKDMDGDGFGDPNNMMAMCSSTPPTGFVANKQDCNDNQVLYRDNDKDGFGGQTKVACGGVANNSDCNDNNAMITLCPMVCNTPGFTPAVTYPSGGNESRSVTTGDFNSDGKTDVLVANNEVSGNIGVLLGNGTGSFAPAANFSTDGGGAMSGAAADFNGDGKLDIAVTNQTSNTVAVLMGNGIGGFAPVVTYPLGGAPGSFPESVTAGDFNGDGKPDLAVSIGNFGVIYVLLNNGTGTFLPSVMYLSGGIQAASITNGDINGDGKLDLVVANNYGSGFTPGVVGVLLGTGTGTFAPAVTYLAGGEYTLSVTIGDFNGDGKPDLATANRNTDNIGVLLNNGSGSFLPTVSYPSGSANPFVVVTADFNDDGKTDIAVANNFSSNNIGVLLGNGSGGFAPAVTFATGGINPYSVATGDFNGDGKPDLAAANKGTHNVSILLNTCGAMNPINTIVQPAYTKASGNKAGNITSVQVGLASFSLSAWPNPVKGITRIQYTLPEETQVRLQVFDLMGREISSVFNGRRQAGTHYADYNASALSAGVYYCRMTATTAGRESVQVKKLVKVE